MCFTDIYIIITIIIFTCEGHLLLDVKPSDVV
jgi:hypothetical protein